MVHAESITELERIPFRQKKRVLWKDKRAIVRNWRQVGFREQPNSMNIPDAITHPQASQPSLVNLDYSALAKCLNKKLASRLHNSVDSRAQAGAFFIGSPAPI